MCIEFRITDDVVMLARRRPLRLCSGRGVIIPVRVEARACSSSSPVTSVFVRPWSLVPESGTPRQSLEHGKAPRRHRASPQARIEMLAVDMHAATAPREGAGAMVRQRRERFEEGSARSGEKPREA